MYEWKCCFKKESGPTVNKGKRTQDPFNSVPCWLISFSNVKMLLLSIQYSNRNNNREL